MKPLKLVLLVMGALLISFGLSGYALAFHEGGVAYCEGCHTMHGNVITPSDASHLLKADDISETCLGCHAGSGSYHIKSDDGSNFKPGGDFYWMTKTFTYVAHNRSHTIYSQEHGHNIKTSDIDPDPDLTQAPGGTYSANDLSCASCHNPHGTTNRPGQVVGSGSFGDDPNLLPDGEIYGNYRLLGDAGYDGAVMGYRFQYNAPIAVAPGNSTISEESNDNHVDYGSGMSEWCGNCHNDFLSEQSPEHTHPAGADADLGSLASNYNRYVKTGDVSANFSGVGGGPYLHFVRFERGITDVTQLHPTGDQALAGPSTTSNVMCLTCHRAHASAFTYSGAWDFSAEFLAESHPSNGNPDADPVVPPDTGVVGDDVLNSYYGIYIADVFGEYQRSFCNKCHVKD